MKQQISQLHTRPVRRAHSTGAPVEPNALLEHVLLLAAVTGTHKRYRERDGG